MTFVAGATRPVGARVQMPARPSGTGARRSPLGVAAVSLVVIAVGVPVVAVLWRTVAPAGSLDLEAFGRMFASARTWRLVGLTVAQAAASCLLTVLVGTPLAWFLARRTFWGAQALRTVAIVPFVLPTVVVGAAFASLLGAHGVVDLRGTWWPILAAHLCFNLAVVMRTVGAKVAVLDAHLEGVARTLGAGSGGYLRRVAMPLLAPSVLAAAVIVFLFCLTSFGVIVLLGGGAVSTVEVEIWIRATRQFDLPGAGVLALLQLLAVVATLTAHARITRTAARASVSSSPARPRRLRGARDRVAALAVVATVGVVSVAPLAALVLRSLRVGDGLGLAHWRNLGQVTAGTSLVVSPLDALAASMSNALVATLMAVALGIPAAGLAARRPGGLADRVLLVPLGVSATTVGLGLLLAVGRPPVDLRRAWWLVPVAQALIALPLLVRVLLPALRSAPTRLDESAALLGAGPTARWWRVSLPLHRKSIVAGTGLAFVACLGEFGATVFLARSNRPTAPVAIEQLMSRPGAAGYGQAMAMACLLAALCALVILAVDRAAGVDRATPGF